MSARYGSALGMSAALHALVVALLMWPGSTPAVRGEPLARRPVSVVVASAEDATFPGLNPLEPAPDASAIEGPSSLNIGNVRIDVQKIGSRERFLFPFVTPGLAVELFFPTLSSGDRLIFRNPATRQKKPRSDLAADRPLVMSDAMLQAVVDKSWARRER